MALLRSGTRIYGNAKIDTVLSIDGQDAATSVTTGALQVKGGIGVSGNVFSSGNITAFNANLGNIVTSNYFVGTLSTGIQPNITSVGTLSNLNVSGNIIISKGISANSSYGDKFDVLTSDGTGNTEWKSRYYYTDVMYDFTEYGMGYQTIAPNQDPITLGFVSNVSIPYGSIWMLITNDGLDDPLPITIYSPSSKSTPMMWVTIDGSGSYDPDTNPSGSDYWFNITPPA